MPHPKEMSDATVLNVSLKWLIGIVLLLMGLASTGGVLAWRVGELTTETKELRQAVRELDRRTMELGASVDAWRKER
jgi:hypothetical protein